MTSSLIGDHRGDQASFLVHFLVSPADLIGMRGAAVVTEDELVTRDEVVEILGLGRLARHWWFGPRSNGPFTLHPAVVPEDEEFDGMVGFTRASVEAEARYWQTAAERRRRARELMWHDLIGRPVRI